jgi:hypothetical protein
METYSSTVSDLRRAILFAPKVAKTIAPGLLGWWTRDGAFICASCAGRIFARGCSLPPNIESCWLGDPYGVCCTCRKD